MASGIVRAVVAPLGLTLPGSLRVSGVEPGPPPTGSVPVADGPGAAARLVGPCYEAALSPAARLAGSHYTPAEVAARLVGLVVGPAAGATEAMAGELLRAWDPTCGGGAFLLALADAFLAAGGDPSEVLAEQLWGTDLDPGAVAVTEAALWLWGLAHGVDVAPGHHLGVADPLVDLAASDDDGPLGRAGTAGFDLVVGNPPFQGQLTGTNVRSAVRTRALKARWGSGVVRPYTDTASLFLVAGASALAPDGRLVMVLPTSVLAARDAAGARAAATGSADLVGLWAATEPVFEAGVEVCAPVLHRRSADAARPAPSSFRRWRGRDLQPIEPSQASTQWVEGRVEDRPPSWAGLALAALDVPEPLVRSVGLLGSLVTARAGFRDEYYGLVGSVAEAPPAPGVDGPDGVQDGFAPLVTSGLVDPGRCRWGERPVRFARTRFERPVIDLARLAADGGRAHAWVRELLVPKVVVATQTRVGEAAVDLDGRWVASTPTVALVADPEVLWRVAAVVCSPVGSVAAFAASAGSARAGAAIRQRASTLVDLPLPVDTDAWDAGADALRRGERTAFLDAMAAAYAVGEPGPLHDWWDRRSPWRV